MERVLVTGAFGFIGFHLIERLLSEGIEVIAIDKMPKDKKDIQEEMKMRVGRNALLTIVEEKIETCPLQTLLHNIDVVYHLASSPSEESEWSSMGKVIEANVNVTKKLVQSIQKGTRLIYPSTVEVYGERSGIVTEKTPTNPITTYGITKLASERVIKTECMKKGISYIILRLPTIYGPWQRDTMTYQQILNGVTTPSIDRSTVDVLYVDDVIDAFLLAAKTTCTNEIFHLTSKREEEWYKGIRLLNNQEIVKNDRNRESHMTLSPEKSEQLLHFTAKTTLEEGLKKQREHINELEKQN